ncbi:3',5'-cyclic-nucleotide phosphodiesterase [Apophysomyces ossiformis]|uniref:3',5'-cyclic-nucleotide phosphodiesterase n=1 Tax=Apophysomyces ossiformis TaxID=679940 RepID=A0A8H7EPR0_9FUNG|nr:3',5'-cyclic-nucleotide phosphodiesterase [Apophysomyces ossiformis]
MDSNHCTAVVLYDSKPQPFRIDGNEESQNDGLPPYMSIFQSVFGQVLPLSDTDEALHRIRQLHLASSPTIFLIDLDTLNHEITLSEDEDIHSLESNNTKPTFATPVPDRRISWIKKMKDELVDDIPIVVCSEIDEPSFMLDCVYAGAVDYLLKPLRLDVIKTLFLKLHRIRPESRPNESIHGTSSPSLTLSCADNAITSPIATSPLTPTGPNSSSNLCDGLQHRIKEIFAKDTQFAKVIMDIYAPLPPHHGYIRLSEEHAASLRKRISSWDFCPFEFTHDELIHCVYLIFEQTLDLPELSHLSITEAQLYDFIIDLSNAYHDGNPYHNFAHAVDVLQCSYFFLCRLGLIPFADGSMNRRLPNSSNLTRAQDLLRPKDMFALLIAAIGHDAAHPGVNNLFLVNSATPLAVLYNDRSVLESFHSMALFQLIKKHGFDQFAGGPGSSDYHEFRKVIVNSVLATDMSLHADYVAKIKDQALRLRNCSMDELNCEEERLLLCSAIIKCADISNVTRPFSHGAKWAEHLVEEFACQGDLERELGMPVMPMNDREKIVLEDMQIGFIRFVAMNLFETVRDVMQEVSFTVDYIQQNLKRWENKKNASHDSGVSSLGDLDQDIVESHKDVLHAVEEEGETLGRHHSFDTVRSDSLFNNLPSMPAVAMTSYGENTVRGSRSYARQEAQQHPSDWPQHCDGAAPVYCQCSIQ